MAHCITIINYKVKEQPIFIVDHLTDIAFEAGFRVLNPEFKADWTKISEGKEALNEWLTSLDFTDKVYHSYKVSGFSARERYLKRNPGMDVSTPKEIY